MSHRVPPLAAAIVFVAAGLVATVWSTRRAVIHAFEAVRDGQAVAVQQAVRAELVDLDGPPTPDSLQAILHELEPKGLRYLAVTDARGRVIASAGNAVGTSGGAGGAVRISHAGDRVRVEMRVALRHAWGRGTWWITSEVAPVEADALRAAAARTLAIGALAALTLLAIAVWLVRNELRRRARERERERERRLASLGEMSAVLAHEIRNPLASLKGNAQLLAASLPQGEKPRAKAERVVDEAVRLEQLTQDLLAFVRTGELARAPVAPVALVREAAGEIAIELDEAAAPATWSLDAARMREVIVNLVDNARAAGPPVSARVAVERRRLVIEIRDHGPGVPAEDRERIFEPFFTGKTRGTGLGLAIAKRIVELHRGTIGVDAPEGGGARFRIEIPEA